MTSQTGLGGNFGGFAIANLTDQNHIRILTQNSAQAAGKGHTGAEVNLCLANSGKIIFHWIFDSHNIALLTIHLLQGSIERGGFTGTGGPGHQNNTVGA